MHVHSPHSLFLYHALCMYVSILDGLSHIPPFPFSFPIGSAVSLTAVRAILRWREMEARLLLNP